MEYNSGKTYNRIFVKLVVEKWKEEKNTVWFVDTLHCCRLWLQPQRPGAFQSHWYWHRCQVCTCSIIKRKIRSKYQRVNSKEALGSLMSIEEESCWPMVMTCFTGAEGVRSMKEWGNDMSKSLKDIFEEKEESWKEWRISVRLMKKSWILKTSLFEWVFGREWRYVFLWRYGKGEYLRNILLI